MSRLTRDGTAEPVSRDQNLRRKPGQGNIHFPCSVDHEQDWQPYPGDPYSCYKCDHTYMYAFSSVIVTCLAINVTIHSVKWYNGGFLAGIKPLTLLRNPVDIHYKAFFFLQQPISVSSHLNILTPPPQCNAQNTVI